jgi:hypothetical protein
MSTIDEPTQPITLRSIVEKISTEVKQQEMESVTVEALEREVATLTAVEGDIGVIRERLRSQLEVLHEQETVCGALHCEPDQIQIAHTESEITSETTVYIGPLKPGIFKKIDECGVDHVYTSFPEGKISREFLEIGGRTSNELVDAINDDQNMNMTQRSRPMMHHKKLTTLTKKENIHLVRLRVRDLGFTGRPTTTKLFRRAKEYGLELCPAETGPVSRLSHPDQPMNDELSVGMDPITDSDGNPSVFHVMHGDNGLWLYGNSASPDYKWDLDRSIVFRLCESDT